MIRLRVTESPSFAGIMEKGEIVRFPLRESLKVGFPRLSLTLAACLANSAVAYAFHGVHPVVRNSTPGLRQAIPGAQRDRGSSPVVPFHPRSGQRSPTSTGVGTCSSADQLLILLWCIVFFPLLNTENKMVAVIAFLGMGLIVPVTHCVQGSIIADTFPAKVRYSGSCSDPPERCDSRRWTGTDDRHRTAGRTGSSVGVTCISPGCARSAWSAPSHCSRLSPIRRGAWSTRRFASPKTPEYWIDPTSARSLWRETGRSAFHGRMSSVAKDSSVAIRACADGLDVRVADDVMPTLCPIGSSVMDRVVKRASSRGMRLGSTAIMSVSTQ